jgi:hypothetical protein
LMSLPDDHPAVANGEGTRASSPVPPHPDKLNQGQPRQTPVAVRPIPSTSALAEEILKKCKKTWPRRSSARQPN